jgi:TolB protein
MMNRIFAALILMLGILSSFLGRTPATRRQSVAESKLTTPAPVGIFESHQDVGTVLHPGSIKFDDTNRTYTLNGSGNNIWAREDDFQFAWKKMSGDVSLAADISILGQGGNPHKKAVLIVRQSLDPDSVYADIALHANGLTALQYRDEKSAVTNDIELNLSEPAPKRLRLDKHGDFFYMSVAKAGEDLHFSGAGMRVLMKEPFYVGIGMCSHDKDVVETAVFSNLELNKPAFDTSAKPVLYSTLETLSVTSNDRHLIHSAAERFEAPNWSRDGSTLVFNGDGRLWKLPATGGKPEALDTGFATKVNNDHGFSPDGTQLAISDNSQGDQKSIVYVLPVAGGTPNRITVTGHGPSYWHGWSPDGKTLAFVGERNGDFDIFGIPATGGEEVRLTTAKGLDDGPDYSPDGKYIYFNSERSGTMQIWRMHADGSNQERVTTDDSNDWFPHPSPDGKWMVFLAYDRDVKGHPENKNVALRLMSLSDNKITTLVKLFGGQGTINVPSWSPDSKQIAYVSYHLVSQESRKK